MKHVRLSGVASIAMISALLGAGAGCAEPWPTKSVGVTSREIDAAGEADDQGVAPEATRAVRFEWSGFIAEEVRVEHCIYDCENQSEDFCWSKNEEYIEALQREPADYGLHGCGWAVGACSSFAECGGPSGGPDFGEMLEDGIDYASVPDRWFVEEGGEPVSLEDGETYSVGVFGYDCSSGECEYVAACRLFRMEDGVPTALQGT